MLTLLQVSRGSHLLHESPAFISTVAIKELRNLLVDIRLQTGVESVVQLADGRQELTLSSSGDKLVVDLYIEAYGLLPNSSYVPDKSLKADGYVAVDQFLRVKGAEDVWAVGDVSDAEPSQLIICERQSVYVAKSIVSILGNKTPPPYKASTTRKLVTLSLNFLCVWLIVIRPPRFPGRQEGGNRSLREHEDPWTRCELASEKSIRGEVAAQRHWFCLLTSFFLGLPK
jgi:NADH dehydrogenase FAD-containing subunit